MIGLGALELGAQVIGSGLLLIATAKLAYVPIASWFELRIRLTSGRRARLAAGPRPGFRGIARGGDTGAAPRRTLVYPGDAIVSVIVPAYNEEVVLDACIASIVRSAFPRLEVIIVDDGSTDATWSIARGLAERHPCVRAVRQDNAGKGAALNRGIRMAVGDILLFVDADGLFDRHTVEWLIVPFSDRRVGAVCGDDRPSNADRPLTRMLSILSHVGTGLVRRALSLLGCLPIVSGNVGAFRAEVVRSLGGFHEHTLGEDLELTWRVHAAGFRVLFEPRAIVFAESPSTVRGLWRQRVRWARGLLQTTWMHRRMIGSPRHGIFGAYLALNTLTAIVGPVLQLGLLLVLLPLAIGGRQAVGRDAWAVLGWLGLVSTALVVVLALVLNGAWRELRNGWTVVLWPLYSCLMGLTMVWAIRDELRRAPQRWNKLHRTGIVAGDARLAAAHPTPGPARSLP